MDAEFHSSPAIPSLAVIVVCSVLLVAMVLIASALVWKHKRKMQNFLPCKTSPQNRCDTAAANGVIYEDLTNLRPRPLPQLAPGHTPCIEMVDVKGSGGGIFVCPAPPRADPYASQDLYNPVYEELSNGSAERCAESDAESEAAAVGSEDDFADEELSLGGEVEGGGDGGGDGGGGSLSGGSSSDASSPPRPSARTPAPRHAPSLQPQPPPPRHPVLPRHDHRGPAHHAPRYVSHLQSADSLAAAAAKEAVEEERGRYTLAAPARGYGIPAAFRAAPTLPSAAAERRGRSLDRRRGWRSKGSQPPAPPPSQPPPPPHEFHEGMLLDALMQLYPGGGGGGRQPGVPSVAHRLPYLMPPTAAVPASAGGGGGGGAGGGSRLVNPYDSVPVLNHLHQQHHAPAAYMFSTFRPPASHDSSFGSDSGYSNHTSGGGGGGSGGGGGGGAGGSGGRTASRSRKDTAHRLSAHSGDLVMS